MGEEPDCKICEYCHHVRPGVKYVRIRGESVNAVWGILSHVACGNCRKTKLRGRFVYDDGGSAARG